MCQLGLRPHVVQKISAALQLQASQGVEVQEIRPLNQAVAVEQPRRGHIHGIDGPQTQGQQQTMNADASGGEPRVGTHGSSLAGDWSPSRCQTVRWEKYCSNS